MNANIGTAHRSPRNGSTAAHSLRRFAGILISAALLAAPLHATGNVVTDWNTIASDTIVTTAGQPPGAAGVWFAYASIAVHDAIHAFHGRGTAFYYKGVAPMGASNEAAVAAAAHRVLVNYFPDQQANLDSKFSDSLANIAVTPFAKRLGIAVGEAAASALIQARAGDGLEADVSYVPGSGPGVWQPTPPGFLAAATPWLGMMRPFTMTGAGQFLPPGPTPLDSQTWIRNYNETRKLGAANSTERTEQQTEIALFWTENTAKQYARAFEYLVENYQLDVPSSAGLMVLLWTGYADAAIGCFNAKYTYNFWRPATAIPAGGGNPELSADPAWLALGTTPNHPEYPAGHACITSAVTTLVAAYFGTSKVHVVVDSLAFTDGVHTHTFEDTDAWFDEVFRARIYAGFHFRHSLVDGGILGRKVARQLLREVR